MKYPEIIEKNPQYRVEKIAKYDIVEIIGISVERVYNM